MENLSSQVNAINDPNPLTAEQLQQTLKDTPQSHPALSRVQAKLVATAETESVISSYDRMHHRHSRS
jgi:hypothetical protein